MWEFLISAYKQNPLGMTIVFIIFLLCAADVLSNFAKALSARQNNKTKESK